MYCDLENCETHSSYYFPDAGDVELCRWHSYLFTKAAEFGDDPTVIKLLDRFSEETYNKVKR